MNYSFTDQHLDGSTPFFIDCNDLKKYAKMLEQWPDLLQDLHNHPTLILNCLSLAVHQVRFIHTFSRVKKIFFFNFLLFQTMYDLFLKVNGSSPCNRNSIVQIQILNYYPRVTLRDLKMQLFGK